MFDKRKIGKKPVGSIRSPDKVCVSREMFLGT